MQGLRSARIAAGLTLEQLGEISGVDKNTVWRWEAGKSNPSIDMLRRLAKYFSCSVDELISSNPTSPPRSGRDSIVLIPETRGRSLVGELRRVVDLLANLAIRSDEPGEVLEMAEDVVDGAADEEATQAFVGTLRLFVSVASQFLEAVEVKEGRMSA